METWITGENYPVVGPIFNEIIEMYWPHVGDFYGPFNYRTNIWRGHNIVKGVERYVEAKYTVGYPYMFEFHEHGKIVTFAPKEHLLKLDIVKELAELEDSIDSIIINRNAPSHHTFAQYFPLFASCFEIITCSEAGWRQFICYYAKINGHYRLISDVEHCDQNEYLRSAEQFIATWIAKREVIFMLHQPIAEAIWNFLVKK